MNASTPSNSLMADNLRDKKSKKKHQTAETSIECYGIIKKSGQIQREKELVLNAINLYQPITSRELSCKTGKERSNITRSIFDLVNTGLVKAAFTEKCKTTNKRVSYYALIDFNPSEEVNTNQVLI